MSAVQAYKTHGVKPSIISYLMRHSREITHYRDCLDKYFLLYWEGKYLMQKAANGIISKDGTDYIVVYSPHCTRGHILAAPDKQYALSFRKPAPEFGLQAYVLVAIPTETYWN